MGCRRVAEKRDLVRIVHDGVLYRLDAAQVAPGRGAYLHTDEACAKRALRARAIPRALRTDAGSTDQLAELVAALVSGAASVG